MPPAEESSMEYVLSPALRVRMEFDVLTAEKVPTGPLWVDPAIAPELARFLLEASTRGNRLDASTSAMALPLLNTLLDLGILQAQPAAARPGKPRFASAFEGLLPLDAGRGCSAAPGWRASGFELNPALWLEESGRIPVALAPRLRVAEIPCLMELELGEGPWAWAQHPRTGVIFPYRLTPSLREALESGAHPGQPALEYLQECGILLRGDAGPSHVAARQARLRELRGKLRAQGYAVLRGWLSPLQQRLLRRHCRALRAHGRFELDREQAVDQRTSMHNEPFSRLLHAQMAGWINELLPEPIRPSYTYLTIYYPGARLERHVDRAQCAWNVSLWIESEPADTLADAWPLHLETGHGTVQVRLAPGDAVLYPGTRMPHWRDRLPAARSATVLLGHFVARDFRGDLD